MSPLIETSFTSSILMAQWMMSQSVLKTLCPDLKYLVKTLKKMQGNISLSLIQESHNKRRHLFPLYVSRIFLNLSSLRD